MNHTTLIVNLRWSRPYDVYVGRGRDPQRNMIESPWGNPFTHLPGKTLAEFVVPSRDAAVRAHRRWIADQPELILRLPELYKKVLGCWCAPAACHADTLSELATNYVEMPFPQWQAFLAELRCPKRVFTARQGDLWALAADAVQKEYQ